MNLLTYTSFLHLFKGFIFLHEDKQLYTINRKFKNKTIYRCKIRTCKARVQIQNKECTFRNTFEHNHNNAVEKYMEMESLNLLNEYLIQNIDKIIESKQTLRALIKEVQIANISNKFILKIENERKIYRLIKKSEIKPNKQNQSHTKYQKV